MHEWKNEWVKARHLVGAVGMGKNSKSTSFWWIHQGTLPAGLGDLFIRWGQSPGYQGKQFFFFFFFKNFGRNFINLFIYLFLLCWVFVSVRGLSLVAASGGHSSSRCAGLSLSRPLLLRSTSSRHAGSVVVAHGPSCSTACGIFPDRGSNPCPLHWQADSQPLRHQGSPGKQFFTGCRRLLLPQL